MTINEAKMQIAKEFITKYTEWLNDHNSEEMSDKDYGWTYGFGKHKDAFKDNQTTVIYFQRYIFKGKYLNQWKAEGINPFELYRAGFLSYDECTSHKARILGKTDFFYISQNKAKEIYKAYKSGFFC